VRVLGVDYADRDAWAKSTSVGISAATCSNVWSTKLQLLLSQQHEH
jgi:hypothetical protein